MVKQPIKKSWVPEFVKDSYIQGGAILGIFPILWRIITAWANIDFLLSVNEAKVAMILHFLQSTGWWLLAIIGFLVLIVKGFIGDKSGQRHAPNWFLLVSCSVVAFLFGTLLPGQSGNNLNIISSWGDSATECHGLVDTSRLLSFKGKYNLGLVCGIVDQTIDVLNQEQITVSNPFEITGGVVTISAPYRQSMGELVTRIFQQRLQSQIWFLAVLIPNDISKEKITTLKDLLRLGGEVVSQGYSAQLQFEPH